MHGVVLKPAPFYEFSETDDKIVRLALKFLKAEDRAIESRTYCQAWNVLDYALVARIRIERLKPVQHYVKL